MPRSPSYTVGSEAMVHAMVERLPDRYPMELTTGDMEALLWALAAPVGFAEIPEDVEERVLDLFTSFAASLDVEGI